MLAGVVIGLLPGGLLVIAYVYIRTRAPTVRRLESFVIARSRRAWRAIRPAP
jgi:hypothetical protein